MPSNQTYTIQKRATKARPTNDVPQNSYTDYHKLSSNKHTTAPKYRRSSLRTSGRMGPLASLGGLIMV